MLLFFFKQKTAYEMRISDWSSDVCSSDLYGLIVTGNVMVDRTQLGEPGNVVIEDERDLDALSRWAKTTKDAGVPIWVQLNHPGRQSNPQIGRASCRERVCQYV